MKSQRAVGWCRMSERPLRSSIHRKWFIDRNASVSTECPPYFLVYLKSQYISHSNKIPHNPAPINTFSFCSLFNHLLTFRLVHCYPSTLRAFQPRFPGGQTPGAQGGSSPPQCRKGGAVRCQWQTFGWRHGVETQQTVVVFQGGDVLSCWQETGGNDAIGTILVMFSFSFLNACIQVNACRLSAICQFLPRIYSVFW